MNRNYIAGEWVASDDAVENRNPSDVTDLVGLFAQAGTVQLETAIEAAGGAQKIWQATGLEARQTALMKIGNALIERADELGELLSREEGKPRAEGRGEVYRAGQFFTYYAAEVLRQIGDNADSVRPDIEIDVRRDPVGIVAVISPWNFPTATAVWKIAPALAFGNAVIWKPANLVPASAVALTEIITGCALIDGTMEAPQRLSDSCDLGLVQAPLLLLPFVARLDPGTLWLHAPGLGRAADRTDGDSWQSHCLRGAPSCRIEYRNRPQIDPARKQLTRLGDQFACCVDRLGTFAHRTYAPATGQSRMSGAGAGLTDND